ncbi:MAG: hypothetical protein HY544_05010 [Candidatus Diapherotrites archaeon]|uniref:Uncharacterized protein n=1 Tax=Candidatus Iainarchaeum sp. TaxID=3101447 RepID=A0A8T3YMB3_9ARCH|nr:hypothetical protein [Candidatus Diapherotrites archaeon]
MGSKNTPRRGSQRFKQRPLSDAQKLSGAKVRVALYLSSGFRPKNKSSRETVSFMRSFYAGVKPEFREGLKKGFVASFLKNQLNMFTIANVFTRLRNQDIFISGAEKELARQILKPQIRLADKIMESLK